MLRSLLADADPSETLGGVPAGDLFALANAVASLIGAPVTIEDRSSRVLAFSGHQDEADPSRVETILGRRVPARYSQMLEARGVFQRLYRSDEPVYIEGLPADDGTLCLPRVAVAVRAGDEFLGSIWAAVRKPLPADRSQAFCDAAKLVALHLMRQRAGADVERRLPSIVVRATDGHHDVVDGKVYLDKELVQDRVDGRRIELDPGPHIIRVVRADGPDARGTACVRSFPLEGLHDRGDWTSVCAVARERSATSRGTAEDGLAARGGRHQDTGDARAHSSIGQSPRLITGLFLVRTQVGLRIVQR